MKCSACGRERMHQCPPAAERPACGNEGERWMSQAESFAQYHDEHARFGGASYEFHARAATFIRRAYTAGRARGIEDERKRCEGIARDTAKLSSSLDAWELGKRIADAIAKETKP